jgi:hypothetical protein
MRTAFVLVAPLLLMAVAPQGIESQEKPASVFEVHFIAKGQSARLIVNPPDGLYTLVLDHRGICDVRPRPMKDEAIKEVLRRRIKYGDKEVTAIHLRIEDDVVFKDGKRMQLADFVSAIERLRSLSDPKLPTYVYVKYGY